MPIMPWMRVTIGVGGVAVVTGIAGMAVLIDDGANYFGAAGALASAGFLTLVACWLTKVFGSSHTSQDEAFKRGRSIGYDAGFLEGRRTARPVVVPIRSIALVPEPESPVSDLEEADQVAAPQVAGAPWGREQMSLMQWGGDPEPTRVPVRNRLVAWVGDKRTPILAGVLSVALIAVVVATALANVPGPTAQALQQSPGTPFSKIAPPSDDVPALVNRPATSPAAVGATGQVSPLAPAGAGVSPALPAGATGATGAAGAGAVVAGAAGGAVVPAGSAVGLASPVSSSGVASAIPAIVYLPSTPVVSPAPVPAPAPVVVAAVVPLTAAQQTAADAAAAAALTKANAAEAARVTAANAAEAARVTAANAKAAADATAAKAAADAWAVAHPNG